MASILPGKFNIHMSQLMLHRNVYNSLVYNCCYINDILLFQVSLGVYVLYSNIPYLTEVKIIVSAYIVYITAYCTIFYV